MKDLNVKSKTIMLKKDKGEIRKDFLKKIQKAQIARQKEKKKEEMTMSTSKLRIDQYELLKNEYKQSKAGLK